MRKFYKNIIALFLLFWLLGAFLIFGVFAAVQQTVPSPTIVINPDIYYAPNDILYLEGRSQPDYNIQLQFSKQGAKPLKFTTKSDMQGEWVLAEKVPLDQGDWEVRARAVDPKNADLVSEWSNPRVFRVILSGVTIGGVNIKFAALFLIIVVLLICGVSIVLYFTWRVRRFKALLLGKEISEAKKSISDSFSSLRQNLLDDLKRLEARQNLSPEELERKEHLLRDLENLERSMEKEIRDIEERI